MGAMNKTLSNRLPVPAEPKLYHLRDMCSLYGVSDVTIHNWSRQGKIPAPGKIGKRPVWSREEVDEHLASLGGKR
jgi:predicted DNA-binding transcriptional regulator AlpA